MAKKQDKQRSTNKSSTKKSSKTQTTHSKAKKTRAKKDPKSGLGWKLLVTLAVIFTCGIIYFDALVQHRFSGKKWAIPATVYARPLALYTGQSLTASDLTEELTALGYRFGKLDGPGSAISSAQQLLIHTRGFKFWDGTESVRTIAVRFTNGQIESVRQLHRKGSPTDLDIVRLEPLHIGGIYPTHQQDRLLVRLSDIPDNLLTALLIVEDREFYQHIGLSFKAILRAFYANITAGRLVQGGSTITQQLVKNFFLSSERSFIRKAVEALMSLLLEQHFSKSEILQAYLNEVYLGQSGPRAIHGFGLASQHYFNRPLSELDLHQYAMLVALVKGPSYYDPWRHPDRALKRRNWVINKLSEAQIIGVDVAEYARSLPLGIGIRDTRARAAYPAYLDLVKRQLRRDYQEQDLNSEGLQIFTNFDPLIQWQAETTLSTTLEQLESQYQLGEATTNAAEATEIDQLQLQGAVVVTSVEGGEVQAVVGGRQPRYAGYNRALDALRPIGSLMKPAIYLSALTQPQRYTLASPISDAPVTVSGPNDSLWQPRNFDRKSHGVEPDFEVLLHQALVHSYNQATARLGMNVGLSEIAKTVHLLGVKREVPQLPSMLLGAIELSAMDVARMYQTIAAGGFHSELRAIREVMDSNGQPLRRYPLTVEQRFSSESIHLLQYAMQEVMREGTAQSAYRYLNREHAVAGKTGTTDKQRDSWFAGFSGDKLAVVWLGRDDNGQTPLTGSSGALSVWAKLMATISKRSIMFTKPDSIDYIWINDNNGLLSDEKCVQARYLPFLKGSAPTIQAPCEKSKTNPMRWLKEIFN